MLGRGQGQPRIHPHCVTQFVARQENQRLARLTVNLEVEGAQVAGLIAGERLAQPPVEIRIACLPDAVTHLDAPGVDVAASEPEADLGMSGARDNLMDPAALLLLVGASGIEHDAVAWFHGTFEAQVNVVRTDGGDAAEEHAAFFAEPAMHKLLVVDPLEPTMGEAAGEGHLEVVTAVGQGVAGDAGGLASGTRCVFRRPVERCPHFVQGLAIGARDVGHIFGCLQPSLDLERSHTGPNQLRQGLDPHQILGTEQVTSVAQIDWLAVGDQAIRHPTGLGADTAIGRAPAERFAGEALSRVGHAEGAVHEGFQGDLAGRRGMERGDFAHRHFPGEHHQLAAQPAGKLDPGRAGDGHLGGGMQRKVGRQASDQPTDPHVLDDRGVGSRHDDRARKTLGPHHLVGEDQRVEGHITAYPAPMQKGQQVRKVSLGKVVGPHPSVELVQAEVDGVGAILHGGSDAIPVAGRGQELGRAGGGEPGGGAGDNRRRFGGWNCQERTHAAGSEHSPEREGDQGEIRVRRATWKVALSDEHALGPGTVHREGSPSPALRAPSPSGLAFTHIVPCWIT